MNEPNRWMTPQEAFWWLMVVFGANGLFHMVVGQWWPIGLNKWPYGS